MLNRSNLKTALAATPDCLSLEALENLTEEAAPAHPHVAQCPRCKAELAMLKSFESDAPLPEEGAAVAWISAQLDRRLDQIRGARSDSRVSSKQSGSWVGRWFGTGNLRWLAPVATAAVLAVAGLLWLHPNKEPDLLASAGNGTAIYRSQEVEVVTLAGELAQAPKLLQWKQFQGAAEYKVAVMEVDHIALWTSRTSGISVTIPSSTRAKMLPGKPVLWQVTAFDRQGQVLATSQVQRFSVARKSPGAND
jgi:hypothetical protein